VSEWVTGAETIDQFLALPYSDDVAIRQDCCNNCLIVHFNSIHRIEILDAPGPRFTHKFAVSAMKTSTQRISTTNTEGCECCSDCGQQKYALCRDGQIKVLRSLQRASEGRRDLRLIAVLCVGDLITYVLAAVLPRLIGFVESSRDRKRGTEPAAEASQ